MKIVKFKNGKYGVRKLTIIGYLFAVDTTGRWECKEPRYFQDQEFDLEYAYKVFEKMHDILVRSNDVGSSI